MGLKPGQATVYTFKKGVSGNPNGRPTGRKNKWTKEAKQEIMKAVGLHYKHLAEDLEKMTLAEKWKTIATMSKYVLSTKTVKKNTYDAEMKISVNYKAKKAEELPERDELLKRLDEEDGYIDYSYDEDDPC